MARYLGLKEKLRAEEPGIKDSEVDGRADDGVRARS